MMTIIFLVAVFFISVLLVLLIELRVALRRADRAIQRLGIELAHERVVRVEQVGAIGKITSGLIDNQKGVMSLIESLNDKHVALELKQEDRLQ